MEFSFEMDWWGLIAAVAVSGLLAEVAFRNGRHWYRTGAYLCGGNLLLSFAILSANEGRLGGSWQFVLLTLAVSAVSYFAWLGAAATFRRPKAIKCFQCEYIQYPAETDQPHSSYNEGEWRAFRSLAAEFRRTSLTTPHD